MLIKDKVDLWRNRFYGRQEVFGIKETFFSKKKVVQLFFSVLLLFTIYLFEILQCISCYLQGDGFNSRFFLHFSFNTLKLAWSAYPEIPLFAILFLALLKLKLNLL